MTTNLPIKLRKARRNALKFISEQKAKMAQAYKFATYSLTKGNQSRKNWENLASRSTEYNELSSRESLYQYIVIFCLISIVCFNILLTQAAVKYLAKQNGLDEFWQNVAATAFPVSLLLIEMALCHFAENTDDESHEKAFRSIAKVLVFITPILVLGTYVAQGDLFKPHMWLLVGMQVALAWATDFLVVSGYERISFAIGYGFYSFNLWQYKRKTLKFAHRFKQACLSVSESFQKIVDIRGEYNRDHPQSPEHQITDLSFEITEVVWFTNFSLKREAILGYPACTIDFGFFDKLDWSTPLVRRPPEDLDDGMMGNPMPNPTPRDPQTGAMDADENENDAAAERDFYRDQLRRNAQQNEREVRP